MSSFVDYLRARLPLVNERLAAASARPLTSEGVAVDLERYLYEPLAHFTAEGGKRVRPVLCLMGAEAAGGNAKVALAPAVAIELFQSAALIHDDIADASELRRGEPCLYKTQGMGVATNMGDLALVQVIDVALQDAALPEERKPEVLRRLVEMELHTLEGQALDLGWARDERWDVTTDDYVYMVTSKTAWYSAASPLLIGAAAAGAGDALKEGLRKVGLHAGIAFQLQDDLLNLVGDAEAQGKDFRSDITEGKRTLAVVHALENLGAAERDELVGILGSQATEAATLARAVELIELGGGIECCRDLAASEVAQAEGLAHGLEQDGLISADACELLCSMAQFFVNRAS